MKHIIKIEELDSVIIDKCSIVKEINSHGSAIIEGHTNTNDSSDIKQAIDTNKFFHIKSDNGDNNIFMGIIKYSKVDEKLDQCDVYIELVAQTVLIDQKKNKNAFINVGTTYDDIIAYIAENSYNNESDFKDASTGRMYVQFLETDWEFLKRLVSNKNGFLVPNYESEAPVFTVGMPNTGSATFNSPFWGKQVSYEEFIRKQKNEIATSILDETSYLIESEDIYSLGTKVSGNICSGVIYKADMKFEQNTLRNIYSVKSVQGLKTIPYFNEKIIGASISATVESVSATKVSPGMSSIGGIQGGAKMIEFATVYSSKSSAGWYCMPEIKDPIRVYFPDEDEDNAYACNAKQVDKADKKPEVKFFRNPSGMEIEFGTDYIRISNGAGLSISLTDDYGIKVESETDKDIQLVSSANIQINSSKDVEVSGSESVKMSCNESEITVQDDVDIKGKQVHVERVE